MRRDGEKHQCVAPSYMPPTGDLAHNPGMCPGGLFYHFNEDFHSEMSSF